MFARVTNFEDFFVREQEARRGINALLCLNRIITQFDKLLDKEPFRSIEKIKTIGAAYMCANGINSQNKAPEDFVGDENPGVDGKWFCTVVDDAWHV